MEADSSSRESRSISSFRREGPVLTDILKDDKALARAAEDAEKRAYLGIRPEQLRGYLLLYAEAFSLDIENFGRQLVDGIIDSGTFTGFQRAMSGRPLMMGDYNRRKDWDVDLGYQKGLEMKAKQQEQGS